MNWMAEFGRRMAMLLRGRKFEREMEEEIRAHIEESEKDLREGGTFGAPLSREQAHTEARKQFGNALALREESREAWGWAWLEHLGQDLRFAFRMFRKNPGFTAIAVLTLALGIGANTAIFSIVDASFLRPLPYPNAPKIFLVARSGNRFGGRSISMAIFTAWNQSEQRAFEHFALLRFEDDATLISSGEPVRLPSMRISTDFLPMAGVHPMLGRNFRRQEGEVGGPNVVMLSYDLWRTRFGSDPAIIGRTILLNGEAHTVVGVLPADFVDPLLSPLRPQLWFPVQVPLMSHNPGNGGIFCFGTLKPGVNIAQAEATLTPSLSELRKEFPNVFTANERAHLIPLREMLNRKAGSAVLLLFGAVGLVLLIACANVANLNLARSAARQREIAVRAAIGASRSRIVRQLLTESIGVALLGGILGVLTCYANLQAITALVPVNLPHIGAFGIDVRVLLFAFTLSVLTGVVFGLFPALGASRIQLTGSLKESSAQSGAQRGDKLRGVLAVSQIAICLVLLIGAALAMQSLAHLMQTPSGFDSSNVLTFRAALSGERYGSPEKQANFLHEALARVSTLPGVEAAGLTDTLPVSEGNDMLFSIEDGNTKDTANSHDADLRVISSGYFEALHVPLLAGRLLTPDDNATTTPVVVINQVMAKTLWPGQNPIGHHVWIGKPMGPSFTEPQPRQIVGVVADMRQDSLSDPPPPSMYIPYEQTRFTDAEYFVLRTRRSPLSSVPDARTALRAIDPEVPITQVRTMRDVVSSSVKDWRFHATLLGIFGGLALLIAAIGVYGVISYSVARRTHEIGIRMALGAQRGGVMRMVLGQGGRLALAGIVIGIVAAFALTRLMTSLLYGVSATDPLTFAGVALLLFGVALVACYVPARRAMKVDPMVALRYE